MLVKGILSFPHVFAPYSGNPQYAAKYSVNVLLPPSDAQIAAIQQEIETAKLNQWPSGAPQGIRVPLQSYDQKYQGKDYYDPRFAGWWVLIANANADDTIPVVNEARQPVLDKGDVYSGAVAHVACGIAAYGGGNAGVGAFLNGVMTTKEEPPMGRLDGKPSVDQMFAGAAAPAAPAAPVAPAMTAAAQFGYEQYIASGWTHDQLVQQGLVAPTPSFN